MAINNSLVDALTQLQNSVQGKRGVATGAKPSLVGGHPVGATGAQGAVGPMSPIAQGAEPANKRKPSDQRFRSFAERYLVSRSAFFRQDPIGMAEDTWSCILDAKRAYGMIERMGQNIQPEDDIF